MLFGETILNESQNLYIHITLKINMVSAQGVVLSSSSPDLNETIDLGQRLGTLLLRSSNRRGRWGDNANSRLALWTLLARESEFLHGIFLGGWMGGGRWSFMENEALVSCLGQGPCFSKITYMVTACKYSEGMYSTVVYCAFFWFPLMDNLGSIPAIDIFFYFRDNSVSCQKLDRLLWKFARYVLSLSAIREWGMHSQL